MAAAASEGKRFFSSAIIPGMSAGEKKKCDGPEMRGEEPSAVVDSGLSR